MKRHIVYTIDNNYFNHMLVSIFSLNYNLKPTFKDKLSFDVISNVKNKMKYPNLDYKEYFIDDNFCKLFKISHHIDYATYFRFLIPEILPEYIDKVLYLDADIIVNGDISPIFDLEFDDDTYLYACDHLFKPEQKLHLKKFGLSEYDDYFNAGVMYIDLKKWRENNISKVLIDYAFEKKDDILWWDQDVLNVIFHKKWKKLHPKYNVTWEVLESNSNCLQIEEAKKHPVIIHYTRSVKPWHSNSYHPYKKLYWKYRRKVEDIIKELE